MYFSYSEEDPPQPLLASDILALFPLIVKMVQLKLQGKMCFTFLAQESEHSAVYLAMQSKTKPGPERLARRHAHYHLKLITADGSI